MRAWLAAAAVILLAAPAGAAAGTQFGAGIASPALGGDPGKLAVGDFNEDGSGDLAVATSYPTAGVDVLLGNGHGGFTKSGPLISGGAPDGIAVGDFNADGHQDLAVTDYNAGTVTVLLGDGRGHFTQAGPPIQVGSHTSQIVAGFFNPGQPEGLAVLESGGIALLDGDGKGGFTADLNSPLTAVASPVALAGDYLGGTGATDLVAAGQDGTVTVLRNSGSGTFTPLTPVPSGVPVGRATPEAITTGDFNGDSLSDVAIGFSDGEVSVLLNTGMGVLSPAPGGAVKANPDGLQITSLAAGDVSGDGATDLVAADYWQGGPGLIYNSVAVLIGDGHGGLSPAPGSPYRTGGIVDAVATGRFIGNGLQVAAADGNTCDGYVVDVLQNQGPNGPSPATGSLADGCRIYASASGSSLSATAGVPFSGNVAHIADSEYSAGYTATITWGDGATSSGTVTAAYPPAFDVSGAHTYAREGTYTITAKVTKTAGTGAGLTMTATSTIAVGPPGYGACSKGDEAGNIRIQGIEVTQGVQTNAFPDDQNGCGLAPGFTGLHPSAAYPSGSEWGADGTVRFVRLVDGRKTVVRVYAAAAPGHGARPPITARLYGYRNGALIASTPVDANPQAPDNGMQAPPLVSGPPTWAERTAATGVFVFTLPSAWTSGNLTLVVEINPSDAVPSVPECAGCGADDVFTLGPIHFTPVRPVFVRSPEVIVQGETIPPPGLVFHGLHSVLPVADGSLRTPTSHYDAVGVESAAEVCNGGDITANLLPQWASQQTYGSGASVNRAEAIYGGDQTTSGSQSDCQAGVTQPGVGWQGGYTAIPLPGNNVYAVSAANRGLTSVSHEFFHSLGLPHAGHNCFNGGEASQSGATWPPEDQGYLQGIGTDVFGFSAATDSYPTIAPPSPDAPIGQQVFDLMSYCIATRTGTTPANLQQQLADWHIWEQIVWISPRTWDALVDRLVLPGAHARDSSRAGTAGAAQHVLRVVALPGSPPVLDAFPGPGTPSPSGSPSGYTLQATGAGGRVIVTVPMSAQTVHREFGPSGLILTAEVPSAGVTALSLTSGGHVIARRTRPASPPRVTLLLPGRRTAARCRPRACTLAVRWRTRGGGSSRAASIDVSTDRGRTWHTVFFGPNRGAFQLPDAMIPASREARVRVRVTDGFDEARAVSATFVSEGSPPEVSILSPVPHQRIAADGSLYLSGTATDDAGRAIARSRLRWYLGSRLLGSGTSISPGGLPAGPERIRLVARDAQGRTTTASVVIGVLAERPQFLVLAVPATASPAARRVPLRVSTLAPATLTVTGGAGVTTRRVAVDRRVQAVVVTVRPGRTPLRLRLRLASGRLQTLLSAVVLR